jgi:hypothetical protein
MVGHRNVKYRGRVASAAPGLILPDVGRARRIHRHHKSTAEAVMKKVYTPPRLHVHGNVAEVTRASQDSDREDRIFNAQGILESTSTGSLDQCFFVPGTYECVIAPGQ